MGARRRRPGRTARTVALGVALGLALTGGVAACASPSPVPTTPTATAAAPMPGSRLPPATPGTGGARRDAPRAPLVPGLRAGNPDGTAVVPRGAGAVDTSHPTRVVGNGTPASCTSAAVVAAVAAGGIITFDCGPGHVTIPMAATAKVVNTSPDVVLDGGGRVTLSGQGVRRILYMNTCDQRQVWTTSHCQNQETPRLVVQNLTFVDGNSTGQLEEGGGGGAIFVRGGQFRVVNSVFLRNRCDSTGPDLGGAAIRVLSQYRNRGVYVVSSTFGGSAGNGGVCSNGGAVSSIGVSWEILNSVMTHNSAIGNGANPRRAGTPGGGSGGAIYGDGNLFNVHIAGSIITDNHANEGGGAVFFVSNDRTGHLTIDTGSLLERNTSGRFQTQPGIFYLGRLGAPTITSSTVR